MALKLDSNQLQTYRLLKRYKDGGILRGHKLGNGSASYRLLDSDANPRSNLDRNAVKFLIDNNLLKVSGTAYTLNDL